MYWGICKYCLLAGWLAAFAFLSCHLRTSNGSVLECGSVAKEIRESFHAKFYGYDHDVQGLGIEIHRKWMSQKS